MIRAVFFDRDGVLVDNVFREGKLSSAHTMNELFIRPETRAACYALREAGYYLFCYTNQPDVSRGHVSAHMIQLQCEEVKEKCYLTDVAICFHDNQDNCSCRKPQPGMLYYLSFLHDIDMNRSWAIGDREKDILAARAAGIPWKQTIQIAVNPFMVPTIQKGTKFVYDLPEAAEFILNNQ